MIMCHVCVCVCVCVCVRVCVCAVPACCVRERGRLMGVCLLEKRFSQISIFSGREAPARGRGASVSREAREPRDQKGDDL